ncbi:cytochrome P450 6a2 isoform X1 [Tribolium castaneum]|uniref:cytochrome P450 6a2 isoform X1 n=2 Tax=Tribolium castaneum TaxID=7070 RepID=UPI00046BF986|nr:PREDICTED: cytochrome P450 6a2 isoform X1 [Tribolium castaneum]|eukprot:XP_970556.2 PREDICTED: cytochrome P450 6a2 isoform X1 [Tribolium castaneum]
MYSISEKMFSVLVFLIIVVVFLYYKWAFTYWHRRNIPYLEPSFPFGNLPNLFQRKENIGLTVEKFYNEMKRRKWKHGGVYFLVSPVYCVIDLEYVKNIMNRDFEYFTNRSIYYNEKDDPLSAHLFAIGGQKWRNLRTKLTATFTSGKMKAMFQTLLECETNLLKQIEDCNNPINIKEILSCFTTDVIGSVGFGLECKTFEEKNSPFRIYGKKVFKDSVLRSLKRAFLTSNFPELARKLGILAFPSEITDFFLKVVADTVKYREENNRSRNDFLQLLIDLKNSGTLSLEEIAAQCFLFFLAGFETSSTTMTFALYELAQHQDIQDKVREEIDAVLKKYGGKITYEAIHDMKYMNQVIDETLRKYPAASIITRTCVKDYKIPDQDIVIEKGTSVIIPVLGIHHDEKFYPNPEKFDPERFTEENKAARHHYAHLPFGEGPRICIGMRFGLVQSKVGLTSLLKNYIFKVNKKTIEPLKMQARSLILAAEGEIWLDVYKL